MIKIRDCVVMAPIGKSEMDNLPLKRYGTLQLFCARCSVWAYISPSQGLSPCLPRWWARNSFYHWTLITFWRLSKLILYNPSFNGFGANISQSVTFNVKMTILSNFVRINNFIKPLISTERVVVLARRTLSKSK